MAFSPSDMNGDGLISRKDLEDVLDLLTGSSREDMDEEVWTQAKRLTIDEVSDNTIFQGQCLISRGVHSMTQDCYVLMKLLMQAFLMFPTLNACAMTITKLIMDTP